MVSPFSGRTVVVLVACRPFFGTEIKSFSPFLVDFPRLVVKEIAPFQQDWGFSRCLLINVPSQLV